MPSLAILCLVACPQVYVVAGPKPLLDAIEPLCAHRAAEGFDVVRHEISTERDAETESAALRTDVHERILASERGYLLLVGDCDATGRPTPSRTRPGLAIYGDDYARFAATIPSDLGYVDIDDDGRPEWACGRLPVRTANEAAALAAKIVDYETREHDAESAWRRELALLAIPGNIQQSIAHIVDNAATLLLTQEIPATWELQGVIGLHGNPLYAPPDALLGRVRATLDRGALATVYFGHGWTTAFAPVDGQPVFRNRDVPSLASAERTVLFAFCCNVGGFQHEPAFGELLARAPHGPCAVVAATDVSTVATDLAFGHEVLGALRRADGPTRIGDVVRVAKRRLLDGQERDATRNQIRTICRSLGLDTSTRLRRHTSDLYHVLGDPALVLPIPYRLALDATIEKGRITLTTRSTLDAHPDALTIEVRRAFPDETVVLTKKMEWADDASAVAELGRFERGRVRIRAFGRRGETHFAGGTTIRVRQ